jgi:methylglutaconyl-CoA hydratase
VTAPLVRLTRTNGVARLTLARPESKNALSKALVAELAAAVAAAAQDDGVRVLVLAGEGSDFCAGADLGDMKMQGMASRDENLGDAQTLAEFFRALHAFPRPVIARVQGSAFGGGVGMIAACDFAIVASDARFAFSEVLLGILPAIISPYVVRRIGETNARRLFLTGERFGAQRALEIGLASEVAEPGALDGAVDGLVRRLLAGSPDAQRRIKTLLDAVACAPIDEAARRTPEIIADARASAEGQEGLRAFFEKRKASWVPEGKS